MRLVYNFIVCITFMLAIPTPILWVVNFFNNFSHTYVQFTIVLLNWYDFTSYYSITNVNFHSLIVLSVEYHCQWLNSTCGIDITDIWFYVPFYHVHSITWFDSFHIKQIYDRVIVHMWNRTLVLQAKQPLLWRKNARVRLTSSATPHRLQLMGME